MPSKDDTVDCLVADLGDDFADLTLVLTMTCAEPVDLDLAA